MYPSNTGFTPQRRPCFEGPGKATSGWNPRRPSAPGASSHRSVVDFRDAFGFAIVENDRENSQIFSGPLEVGYKTPSQKDLSDFPPEQVFGGQPVALSVGLSR